MPLKLQGDATEATNWSYRLKLQGDATEATGWSYRSYRVKLQTEATDWSDRVKRQSEVTETTDWSDRLKQQTKATETTDWSNRLKLQKLQTQATDWSYRNYRLKRQTAGLPSVTLRAWQSRTLSHSHTTGQTPGFRKGQNVRNQRGGCSKGNQDRYLACVWRWPKTCERFSIRLYSSIHSTLDVLVIHGYANNFLCSSAITALSPLWNQGFGHQGKWPGQNTFFIYSLTKCLCPNCHKCFWICICHVNTVDWILS